MPGRSTLALVLALPLALAGCASPGPDEQATGGAKGLVLIGPTCPVERDPPEPGCDDRPYAARLQAMRGDGTVVRFESGEDGRFHVALAPGQYTIAGRDGNTQPPTCSSPPFAVEAGAYTDVDVSCDSGIR